MEDYQLTDTEFRLFRELIYKLCGITLSDAKRHLVRSRLQKRLRHYGLSSFMEYYNLLVAEGDSSPELGDMINCITTNKTDFYREKYHFDFVSDTIVPEMIRRAEQGEIPRRLRVWHAGCSTGEEPYTLGITLAEAFAGKGTWDYRQLASDIDTTVLAHAERGVYEEDRIAPVPDKLLRKYFLRGKGEKEGHYQVRRELRERITFRQINLLAENWPLQSGTKFDIIFCRNVVIYFDKPTRQQLFARYAERLKPGGYLFIGHSESLLGISDAFDSLGKTIYRLPEYPTWEQRAA